MQFLDLVFWNNTVLDYIVFVGALLLGAALIFVLGRAVLRRIAAYTEKTQSPYGELVRVGVKRYLLPVAYFTLFYNCTRMLTLNSHLGNIVGTLSTLFAVIMASIFLSSLATLFLAKLGKGKLDQNSLAMRWLIRITKGVIWGIALILFLDNIGVKITSLVTGLGIGGVAIAFAAQSALSEQVMPVGQNIEPYAHHLVFARHVDPALIARIDAAIRTLKVNGEWQAILARYHATPP